MTASHQPGAASANSQIDQDALQGLLLKAVSDFGGAYHTPLVVIGDKLGLYKALAEHGPLEPAALAKQTGTTERYIREWLNAQAAGGYVSYDADAGRYYMTREQAMLLADEDSPAFVGGAFGSALAAGHITPVLEKAFRTGKGIGWDEHDHGLFCATERFFRPLYLHNLVASWIPALDGVQEKLRRGAVVADVGCGHGASTVIMAQAYPHSRFLGFDYHRPSIEAAIERAAEAGVSDRCTFHVASAKDFPAHNGRGYDLVGHFDCLHDMGDPAGAAAHVRRRLDDDGTWMVIEPFANDSVQDNLNPVGRAFYSVSTLVCTPCSLSQEVGAALGAQAGPRRLREKIEQGGFTRIRLAAQTPFNLIIEARA